MGVFVVIQINGIDYSFPVYVNETLHFYVGVSIMFVPHNDLGQSTDIKQWIGKITQDEELHIRYIYALQGVTIWLGMVKYMKYIYIRMSIIALL